MLLSRHHKNLSGFTLVELLITIALFSILVSIAIGGFVRALRAEREVSAMMFSESNISIALEEMTREMRTGYLFCHAAGGSQPSATCSCSVTSDGIMNGVQIETWTCKNIEFYNANGEKVDYELQNGVLERADNDQLQPITSNNVDVTYLDFTIFGNLETDNWNPRVTVAASVEPNDTTISWPTANLQTTVSARGIDGPPPSP